MVKPEGGGYGGTGQVTERCIVTFSEPDSHQEVENVSGQGRKGGNSVVAR